MDTHIEGPQVLVLRDRALRPRFVGSTLALTGVAGMVLASGTSHPWALRALAVVALLIGALATQLAPTYRLRLDRGAGTVEMRTTHLIGTSSVVHRLADVGDIVLERRAPEGRVSAVRIALVMRDGTHRGWGSYAGEMRADHVRSVGLAREFLGTAHSTMAFDGTVAFPRPATQPKLLTAAELRQLRLARWVFGGAVVVGIVLLTGGVYLTWMQHDRLTRYVAAPATVITTGVATVADGNGQRASRPVVRYRYSVDGIPFTNDVVTPLDTRGNVSWAQEVVGRYRAGEAVTVFYDPIQPAHAYIARERSIIPWMLIGGPLFFIGGFGVGFRMAIRDSRGRMAR